MWKFSQNKNAYGLCYITDNSQNTYNPKFIRRRPASLRGLLLAYIISFPLSVSLSLSLFLSQQYNLHSVPDFVTYTTVKNTYTHKLRSTSFSVPTVMRRIFIKVGLFNCKILKTELQYFRSWTRDCIQYNGSPQHTNRWTERYVTLWSSCMIHEWFFYRQSGGRNGKAQRVQ